MLNKNTTLLLLTLFVAVAYKNMVFAADANVVSVNTEALPINVANKVDESTASVTANSAQLVSPSQAKSIPDKKENAAANSVDVKKPQSNNAMVAPVPANNKKDDFDFDLKIKSVQSNTASTNSVNSTNNSIVKGQNEHVDVVDIPKEVNYKADPIDGLGNSVLSQMDDDLFKQMSDIEKSTTLLTLELKREKLRNEIEAQKAVRQRNVDNLERLKKEQELKDLERKKQIEADVIKEQQTLVDKQKLYEVLRQRKLLNAYMNKMLETEQEWLKEKEQLYAKLAEAEKEKKALVALFKDKIDNVLEVSAKNIQVAETAKANFERIVKGLTARNEQLRKRVEADAKIIKSARNNLYLNSRSIDELKERSAVAAAAAESLALAQKQNESIAEVDIEDEEEKLSTQYAILGIKGKAGSISIELIDKDGQLLLLREGSILPTGHIVSEIGPDYAKFNFNEHEDFLYIGKGIDGYTPNLNVSTNAID